MRALATLLCAAGCVLIGGCGSIGEPLYPALNIPQKISDLVAVERGDRIYIYFTIPSLTTEGLVVRSIDSLDLRAGVNPASGFNLAQWIAGAKRIDISAPAQPGPFHTEIRAGEFVGKEILATVRVGNTKGRMSEWSNVFAVNIEPPLEKPADFQAQPAPDGVRLTWNAPHEHSFRIFRKADQEKEPALLATTDKPEYVDTATDYGKPYEYYVQGIHEKTESDTAGPASITPTDIFPPAVPSALSASAGLGAVELAWERNTEADFKEYRVYRSEENGPFVQIAGGVEGPSYSDRKIEAGKHYKYRVVAVDQTGNPSEPSQPVEIIAP
jgi:fibronectin type 3 domain-containing protein